MLIKGKKALGEMMLEIAFSIILMAIIFVALLYVSGSQTLSVHATIKADRADFACANSLITVMNFKYDDNYSFEQKLVSSYANQDYSEFRREFEKTMNQFIRQGDWKLKADDGSDYELFGAEDFEVGASEKITICAKDIPVPCTENCGKCVLNIMMVTKYEE